MGVLGCDDRALGVTESDFTQLPLLVVLTNLSGLLPLPFLFLLPNQVRLPLPFHFLLPNHVHCLAILFSLPLTRTHAHAHARLHTQAHRRTRQRRPIRFLLPKQSPTYRLVTGGMILMTDWLVSVEQVVNDKGELVVEE